MLNSRKLAVVFAAALATIVALSPAQAAPGWTSRPGTIAYALSQPDGTGVSGQRLWNNCTDPAE